MSVKYDVLAYLENNSQDIISGEDLAKMLCVSRNSIWKAIKSLRENGYDIQGITNIGYKLLSNNNIISAQSIVKYLKSINCDIQVYQTIDSTNTKLKELALNGSKERTIVISEEQTKGKGRLGRTFVSSYRTGLYMSILLRPKFSANDSLLITTAAAVAVATAVEQVSGKETKIKWVNDVYMNDRKICGILTEAAINFENGGLDYAVLGIGINIQDPIGGFPEDIKNIAGSIYTENAPAHARSQIAAAVIDNFFGYYNAIPCIDYIDEYRNRSFLTGKYVTMIVGNREESGTVISIDGEARLVLRLDNGKEEAFSAGEANIKKGKMYE